MNKKDAEKSKAILISELADLDRQIAQLEASAAERKPMEEALRKGEKRTTELLTVNAILTEQIAKWKQMDRSVQIEVEDTPHPVPVNEAVQEAVQVEQPRWKDGPEARGVSIQVLTELEEYPPLGASSRGCTTSSSISYLTQLTPSPKAGQSPLAQRGLTEESG